MKRGVDLHLLKLLQLVLTPAGRIRGRDIHNRGDWGRGRSRASGGRGRCSGCDGHSGCDRSSRCDGRGGCDRSSGSDGRGGCDSCRVFSQSGIRHGSIQTMLGRGRHQSQTIDTRWQRGHLVHEGGVEDVEYCQLRSMLSLSGEDRKGGIGEGRG